MTYFATAIAILARLRRFRRRARSPRGWYETREALLEQRLSELLAACEMRDAAARHFPLERTTRDAGAAFAARLRRESYDDALRLAREALSTPRERSADDAVGFGV